MNKLSRIKVLPIFLPAVLLLALTGCVQSKPMEPVIPEKTNSARGQSDKLPITQIRQTLNLAPEQAFLAALNSFQRRSIGAIQVDGNAGIIESDWVNMNDHFCGGARMSLAPLPCRAKYSVKVEPLLPKASTFHIRFEEICSGNEEVVLVCADSSGEKLMRSVAEDVRNLDEQLFPAKK